MFWFPAVLIGDTSLLSLGVLGLVAAFAAIDDVSVGQTWFGQPLVIALITGFFCGDPLTGLAIGLPLQLVLAGNLPVGQTFTGDSGVALTAAVAAACLSGRVFVPDLEQVGFADLGLLGWIILAAGLLSALGHPIIQAERKANGLLMLKGHKTLRDGSLVRMEAIHVRCLATTFGRGFVLVLLYLLLLMKLWLPLYAFLPAKIHQALGMLPLLLPGLGVGTMIDRYGLRTGWAWLLAGLLIMLALAALGV
jgi:mannose/fructose/N-acetylgalactosamine-specific phosphotransferase system component IIC